MKQASQDKDAGYQLEYLQEIVTTEHSLWEAGKHSVSGTELAPWERFAQQAKPLTGAVREKFLLMVAKSFGNDMVQKTLRILQGDGEQAGQQNNHR
ncbi:MAG TPA: hypothetical protein PLF40_21145 [Kofleriaceae bacterium]|nr:hypothetical protein [Kofleriaceae bacterium]